MKFEPERERLNTIIIRGGSLRPSPRDLFAQYVTLTAEKAPKGPGWGVVINDNPRLTWARVVSREQIEKEVAE